MTTTPAMPELPETTYSLFYEEPGDLEGEGCQYVLDDPGYTADQMRAYATQYAMWSERLRAQPAGQWGDTQYFKREIGEESDWTPCTHAEYVRLSKDPHHDTKAVTEKPTQPAGQCERDEPEENEWRDVALRFDRHRMQALWHLQAMLKDPEAHAEAARSFIKSPPVEPTQPAGQAGGEYVECRECSACGHVGINDAHNEHATCSSCGWSGRSPSEDRCPGCSEAGTMSAACPKCSGHYRLLADANLAAPQQQAGGEVVAAVLAEREACAAICDTTPGPPFRPSIEAAHAIRSRGKQRCPACGYKHGHAIGCTNNPVDIALAATPAPEPKAEPVPSDQAKWCEYVAGMVYGWLETLKELPPEERCTKAIAGIIGRRLWALKQAEPVRVPDALEALADRIDSEGIPGISADDDSIAAAWIRAVAAQAKGGAA